MRILTVENTVYNLDRMPAVVSDKTHFSVLDNTNPKDPDFQFVPLIYIESFNAPAIVLEIGDDRIGKHRITMPLDWSIALGDKEDSDTVEVLPLTSIAHRGFSAFAFNPLKGFKAEFFEVNVVDFYNDIKWYFPKIKNNQLLSVPLTDTENPYCVFFVKDISRQCESIEYTNLLA